jgi:hypothetical protein
MKCLNTANTQYTVLFFVYIENLQYTFETDPKNVTVFEHF